MRHAAIPALALSLFLAGCAGSEAPPDAGRARIAQHLTVGDPVVVENLTVWPVFTDSPLEVGEFLTLEEALEKGLAEVREVGAADGGRGAPQQVVNDVVQGDDRGAVVNTVVIENRADLPILVCGGTLVTGGQQDRQIPQDVIVTAKSTIPVDAFCVEQGRWVNERLGEATDAKFAFAESHALRHVRIRGQYDADQQGVWDAVAEAKLDGLNALGAVGTQDALTTLRDTTSLALVQEATEDAAGKQLDAVAQKVREHFAAQAEAPVGFAYAVNGKAIGVRAFAHPRLFAKQFDPLLRSACLEARLERVEGTPPAATAEDVAALVAELEAAKEELKRTAGANDNGLRKAGIGYNSRCYLREGKLVVTEDWTRR